MAKTGRPSLYTPELAQRIVARIAGGLSLRRVCRSPGMPTKSTVFRWVAERAEFRDQYTRAMETRGALHGEEVSDIADDCLAGRIPPDVARVAMDGKKWAASRMAPKLYGDRVAHEVSGSVTHEVVESRRSVQGKLARLEAELGAREIPRLTH